MIDICTVVFRDEIETLRTQARSVSLYCANIGIQSIYVVVNDDDCYADQIDPQWWGNLKNLVRVISRSTFSAEYVDNGWLSQQVLKLQIAALSNNKWCMALDAKTFFVQPFPIENLFDDQNRLAVGTLHIYPVFERSKQIADNLWNMNLTAQLGPGGVPFFFEPCEVRAIIADIETRTKENFVSWFQAQGMLTEFILYSAWIERQHGLTNYTNVHSIIQTSNLCHSDVPMADTKFTYMEDKALTVSIHRHAWPNLTIEQQQRYLNLLIQRGLQ